MPTGADDGLDSLRARVLAGALDGLVHVQGETVEAASAAYYGRNVSNIMDLQQVEHAVAEAVTDERLAAGRAARGARARADPAARVQDDPADVAGRARGPEARRSSSPRSC